MVDFLQNVTRLAMVVFLLASMLEFGLGLRLREVLLPLRSARLVILSLLANFLIAPLLAVAIARILRLDRPFAIGLILLGLTPGAPFMPKVVQAARHGLGFAIGLLVLLMVGTAIYLPLALPLALPGAEVEVWKIARSLILFLLLPLSVGMAIGARTPSLPAWLRPSLGRLSSLSGLVVLVLLVALNLKSLPALVGTGAILASVVFVALSALSGWMAGGKDRATREVLMLGTGLRNVAAALLVGAQSFDDPRVNVMVIVSALVGLLILLPTARALGRRAAADRSAAPPDAATPPRIGNNIMSIL